MLSAAAVWAALGPCFGSGKHVIHLEVEKKKKKNKSGSQSEGGGSAIGVRMTSLSGHPSSLEFSFKLLTVTALRMSGTTIKSRHR